jgi:hypothetical protein
MQVPSSSGNYDHCNSSTQVINPHTMTQRKGMGVVGFTTRPQPEAPNNSTRDDMEMEVGFKYSADFVGIEQIQSGLNL